MTAIRRWLRALFRRSTRRAEDEARDPQPDPCHRCCRAERCPCSGGRHPLPAALRLTYRRGSSITTIQPSCGGSPHVAHRELALQADVVKVRIGSARRDQLVATEGLHHGNSGTIQPRPRCRGASDPQWEVAMSSSRTEQREASRAQRAEQREVTRAQRAAHISGRIEWYLLLAAVGFALFLALHLQLLPIVAWTGWSAAAVICALLFGILLIWVSEHRRTP